MNEFKVVKAVQSLVDRITELETEREDMRKRIASGKCYPALRATMLFWGEQLIADYRIVGQTVYSEDSDGYSSLVVIETYNHSDNFEVMACAAIRKEFTDDGNCGHNYDCCGCIRRSAQYATALGNGFYLIKVNGIRNI